MKNISPITFIDRLKPDGAWDVQLWPPGYLPVAGKVYTVRIPVPAELIGATVEASIESVKSSVA